MALVNVVMDYDWTSIPRGSGLRKNAPRVTIRSYKINSSESLNRLRSYGNVTEEDPDKFYDKLYGGITDPEDTFRFPFLGDAVRSFSNEYGDTFQSAFLGGVDSALGEVTKLFGEVSTYKLTENAGKIADNIKNMGSIDGIKSAIKEATKGTSTAPGSYIETPKLYQYSQNDSGLEVSFVLSNTINADSVQKNYELVKKLTTINRPKRLSAVTMEPPRIYTVMLPGIRYIKWASCSNFSVQLLGAKRLINGHIIPEGYIISMTFTSLTTEVSNFMDKIDSDLTSEDVAQFAGNLINNATNSISNSISNAAQSAGNLINNLRNNTFNR